MTDIDKFIEKMARLLSAAAHDPLHAKQTTIIDCLEDELRPVLLIAEGFASEIDEDIRHEHGGTSDRLGEFRAAIREGGR